MSLPALLVNWWTEATGRLDDMARVHTTKHVTVMRIAAEQPYRGITVFDNSDPDDDEGREPERYMCDHQMWGDLGEPEVITVTVEPGDLLNG